MARKQAPKNRKRTRKLEALSRVAATEGNVILPSTKLYVRKIVRRAEKAGTLKTPQQMRTSSVALIAAAVKAAKQEGQIRVSIGHVKKGWREHLVLAYGGNCPPHKCLFRSVISRQELLSESEPLFKKFHQASEEV